MNTPTNYEKNNLPEDIKIKYCKIIEDYQIIIHYENGVITKDELVKQLITMPDYCLLAVRESAL